MSDYEDLFARFPTLFPTPGGFSIGDGWYKIMETLCEDLVAQPYPVRFAQVKNKFGILRVYTTEHVPAILAAVAKAERASETVCERCGGARTMSEGWRSLCEACL